MAGYGWMKWANLSSEQQQALQQAGNKFFQAVDAVACLGFVNHWDMG